MKEVAPYRSTFGSMSNRQLENYFAYNKYCYEHFGMSSCAKFEMMALSCDKFKDKLLHNPKLSESAVLELLYDYLAGCNRNKQKYKDLEETVKRVVDTRISRKKAEAEDILQQKIDKQRQQAQQELQNKQRELHQKFIEQQHNAVQDVYLLGDVVSDEIEQAREEALELAGLEGYMQYDQSYELDEITRGYLLYQNISYIEYLHCYGTALQQQYHKEVCDIFTQAAHQHLNIENRLQHQYQSPVLEHATNFAQAAQQTNQKDWTSVTGVLTGIGMLCVDLCKEVYSRPLEYARAIAQGTFESAYDFGYMMLRPDKALYGLGQMLFYILETAALIEASDEFPDYAGPKLQQRKDQITAALSAMQQEFVHADGPARVKVITKFGADFYLPGKLTHAAGYLIGGISSRARGMRTLEGVSSLLDESLITAETAEKIHEIEVVTQQGFTQKIVVEFMEADSTITKAAKFSLRPLNVIIDEVKKLGGVIPLHCKELMKEFKTALKQLEQQLQNKQLNTLQKLYGSQVIDNRRINVSLKHIFNFELNLKKSKRYKGYVLDIKGGHLSGVCEELERTGLIKIIDKKVLSSGAVDYYLQNNLTGKMLEKSKTIFPSNWTAEKIAKAIWEVYENPISKDTLCNDKVHYQRVGFVDNVEVEIVFRDIVQKNGDKNYDVCNIKTTMPYKEVKK